MLLVCYTAVFSVVTQRPPPPPPGWPHDTKNGCVADYNVIDYKDYKCDLRVSTRRLLFV